MSSKYIASLMTTGSGFFGVLLIMLLGNSTVDNILSGVVVVWTIIPSTDTVLNNGGHDQVFFNLMSWLFLIYWNLGMIIVWIFSDVANVPGSY